MQGISSRPAPKRVSLSMDDEMTLCGPHGSYCHMTTIMIRKEHQYHRTPESCRHVRYRCPISSLTHYHCSCSSIQATILSRALFARSSSFTVVVVVFADLAQHVLLSEPKNPLLRSLSPLVQNSLTSLSFTSIAVLSLSDFTFRHHHRHHHHQ